MNNLLSIKGAVALTKSDQLSINGGVPTCQVFPCPPGLCCHPNGHCCDPRTDPNC